MGLHNLLPFKKGLIRVSQCQFCQFYATPKIKMVSILICPNNSTGCHSIFVRKIRGRAGILRQSSLYDIGMWGLARFEGRAEALEVFPHSGPCLSISGNGCHEKTGTQGTLWPWTLFWYKQKSCAAEVLEPNLVLTRKAVCYEEQSRNPHDPCS